ncbi:MAG TPA: TetR/AcrR family transcriptional regulator [Candidatus Binatus sp.]|nr:TetR/AcrR family transcriptional regulator [Candidatus Binatus sp.]
MSALQEERSAETRRRLLDATVACLFERGYAGTTTTEIASRAGVSRGAQLHHFPRKDELVVSALEHVFELRLSEMSAAIAEPPPGNREARIAVLIDTMWPMFKGPTFYAWLELVVASRTDPALNDAVRAAGERFAKGFKGGLRAILDWPVDREDQLQDLMGIVFGQLESLALERVLFEGDVDPPDFVRALETTKRICAAIAREIDSK